MSGATAEEIDELEAKVTRLLGTASASLLEETFGEIGLTVPPTAVGKSSTLLRTLNKYLNSQTVTGTADEGVSVYGQVAAVLEKQSVVKQDDESGHDSDESDNSDSGSGVKKGVPKSVVKTETGTNGLLLKPSPDNGGLGLTVTKAEVKKSKVDSSGTSSGGGGLEVLSKLKEFKMTGTVGGEKPMPYTSMVYQIQNGQRMGYPDHVICAAVLKATAAGPVRTYLELRKDLTVSSLLEILKTNFSVKDSGALFTELCSCTQDGDQKVGDFAFQLMVLREMIIDLGEEEGTPYDKTFLQKRLLRSLYLGIRSDSIRMELNSKNIFGDASASDEKILGAINRTVAQETERLEKLQASDAAAAALSASKSKNGSCNSVEMNKGVKSAEVKSLENKKQRENHFQNQLTELQAKSDRQEKELQAIRADQNRQHAELMSVLMNNANNNNNGKIGGAGSGGNSGGAGSGRKIYKCKNCQENNVFRCTHCFKCGVPQTDHKVKDCPLKAEDLNGK